MKKILFPTDFSENANHALIYALEFCNSFNCELIILYACHIDTFAYQSIDEDSDENQILLKAREKLQSYCDSHSSELNKIKFTTIADYGLAGDSISEEAKKNNVDLIIMGTRGGNSLEEALLGSNTLSVINKTDCPVLAIPEKSEFTKISQIAFATDYREKDIESIKYLVPVAAMFDAEIIIVHVSDYLVPASFENALFEIFSNDVLKNVNYKKITFKVLTGLNPSKTINGFLSENKITLLALSSRKKNIFTKLFDKSFTKKMLYHSDIPLLAFHTTD